MAEGPPGLGHQAQQSAEGVGESQKSRVGEHKACTYMVCRFCCFL